VCGGENVAFLFSHHQRVYSRAAQLLPFVGCSLLQRAISAAGAAALEACVEYPPLLQAHLVRAIVTVLLGALLAFVCQLGLLGLWLGIAIADSLYCTIISRRCYRIDWVAEQARAAGRLEEEEILDGLALLAPHELDSLDRAKERLCTARTAIKSSRMRSFVRNRHFCAFVFQAMRMQCSSDAADATVADSL
jgi:hypothetical protein